MKTKFILGTLISVYAFIFLPVFVKTIGDHSIARKYLYEERYSQIYNPSAINRIADIAKANSVTVPLDNGLSLLIVMVLGIAIIKIYGNRKQEEQEPVTEKIY